MSSSLIFIILGFLGIAFLMNRPPQVIIVQRSNSDFDGNGIPGLLSIVLAVLGLVFLNWLWKNGNLDTIDPFFQEKEPLPQHLDTQRVSYYHESNFPEKESIDNTRSISNVSGSMPPANSIFPAEADTKQNITGADSLPVVWVVLLKRYLDKSEAYSLLSRFSKRSIDIVEMNNDEFWAVIYLDNKAACALEVADWERHKEDWSALTLRPQVIDLYHNGCFFNKKGTRL